MSASAWVNSAQADQVAAFYTDGHSVKETAECFGITKGQVNNLAKKRRLTNGKEFREARCEYRLRETKANLINILSEKGFEYIDGFEGKASRIRFKCRECGTEMERTYSHIRNQNAICKTCDKIKNEQKKEEREKEREARKKQEAELRAIQRELEKRFNQQKSSYDNIREAELNATGICNVCGKPYVVRDYVQSMGLKYARNVGVCSSECNRKQIRKRERERRKRVGKKDNHRKRAREYGCEYDPSITLKRLIKRDGLQCKICGNDCKLDDHSWSKYAGPLYPSIDHIIPMAKGGGHTWNNVQVAHMICNSKKSDSV